MSSVLVPINAHMVLLLILVVLGILSVEFLVLNLVLTVRSVALIIFVIRGDYMTRFLFNLFLASSVAAILTWIYTTIKFLENGVI